MGFELKHYAFMTVLICSIWAMVVSGFTSVEELGKIEVKSEIPQEDAGSKFSEAPIGDNFNSMVKVLNVALPCALVAIVLLVITYNANPIGFGSLAVAIVIFLFASSKTMDAADIINATSEFSLDGRVWWM